MQNRRSSSRSPRWK